ncbi:TetR family transcriptional regulator [Mycobacterium syngnathidarum]
MYPHYKSKESLLFAISVEAHRAAMEAVLAADDPRRCARDRLGATVAGYVTWHVMNPVLARVVHGEMRSLSMAHRRTIAALHRQTTDVFDAILRAGCDSGVFGVADREATVLVICSMCIVISRWYDLRTGPTSEVVAAQYVELVRRMVGASRPSIAPRC